MHVQAGDRVAYASQPPGAYCEVREMPAKCVVRLPDGIDFEQGAAMMLKGLTAQYLLRKTLPQGGLQQGDFQTYTAVESYPNIALVGIPTGDKLTWRQMVPTFKAFQKQRTSLDAIELIIRWLAFGWGAGRAGNPLLEGFGIPSSAMLETVFSALGHDLTPGLESRSSCPEALWQAIKWWHGYYGEEGRLQPRCLYRVDHRLVPSPRPRQAQGPKQGQSAS